MFYFVYHSSLNHYWSSYLLKFAFIENNLIKYKLLKLNLFFIYSTFNILFCALSFSCFMKSFEVKLCQNDGLSERSITIKFLIFAFYSNNHVIAFQYCVSVFCSWSKTCRVPHAHSTHNAEFDRLLQSNNDSFHPRLLSGCWSPNLLQWISSVLGICCTRFSRSGWTGCGSHSYSHRRECSSPSLRLHRLDSMEAEWHRCSTSKQSKTILKPISVWII